MTQNIFYKSCNELAGGVLCRAVGIPEPAPPQHWENWEKAEARTQGTGKGSTWGSGEVESALGGGPRPRPREQGKGLGWAQGGSGRRPSLQRGNRNHFHHGPRSGQTRCTRGRPVAFSGGFLVPWPSQGGPGKRWGLWQCSQWELLPKLRVRNGGLLLKG